MKIIAVDAFRLGLACLMPACFFFARRLLEANDRLKSEVKRLNEAADEREKDAERFKVTKRARKSKPETRERGGGGAGSRTWPGERLFCFFFFFFLVFQTHVRTQSTRRDEAM